MLVPARIQKRRTSRPIDFTEKITRLEKQPGRKPDGEPFAEIAHDALNVVSALQLYCDLLAEPGVLSDGHQHFAGELRAVVATSSGLVEQLAALSKARHAGVRAARKAHAFSSRVNDLAAAAERLKGPLATLAGTNIVFEVECLPCPGRTRLSQEGLTRILFNLTRNAAEAMPNGGCIRITVQLGGGSSFLDFLDENTVEMPRTALLCVQDSGPGIREGQIGQLFDAGFTTKKQAGAHRGLGLSIVRRLAEAAGGRVQAFSTVGRGARFEVELPLIGCVEANQSFVADFPERSNLEC